MMRPIEINAETRAEAAWLWHVWCPGCGVRATLRMTESQVQVKRALLISESDFFIHRPAVCQGCEHPTYLKFQLDQEDQLVGCLTDEPYTETRMSSPEADPTPGYIFSLN